MPTQTKSLENMTKHLTNAEKEARQTAESSLRRENARLKKPTFVTGPAAKLWTLTLQRMEGIELLDDLDSEILGLYCDQMARRNDLERLRKKAVKEFNRMTKAGDEGAVKYLEQADGLAAKVASLERQILQYAEKLGLTPSGRIRIARRRAEGAQPEPDDDLFGGG